MSLIYYRLTFGKIGSTERVERICSVDLDFAMSITRGELRTLLRSKIVKRHPELTEYLVTGWQRIPRKNLPPLEEQ